MSTRRKEWNVLVLVFSGEQRISVQWNSCICQVHQHHDTLNWIQLSSHSIPLLLSAAFFEVLPVSRRCWAPGTQVWLHRGTSQPIHQPQSVFVGSAGSPCRALLCSISHLAPQAHHLGSLLLMSEEDFASVFPLSYNFLLLVINELIPTSMGRVWAHLLLADSACQACDAVRAAVCFGEKCWERRHDGHTLDMIYTQTTLTDIRQTFLHVINKNKCCVGRSGNCRLVTTVYSEFINLQSKSKFTRVGTSEGSNWSSPKPHQTWCPEWDETKLSDSNEFRVFKQR